MAGAFSWLHQQRKSELVSIADNVGLKGYDSLLKAELETALDEHIRANQTTLVNNPVLEPYFKRAGSSPVKRESGGAFTSGDEVKKPRVRRPTKAREELEQQQQSDSEPPSTVTALARTPRSALTVARNLPLPPSPAQLADRIETQTNTLTTTLSGYVSSSPLPSLLNRVRATLSSAIAIELLTLFIEAWGLRSQVLPMRYLTTVPAMPALGTGDFAIKIPDLFALLTFGFWGPVGLWLATSVGMPLIGAWMFNLTHAQRDYDPVSFNVVKGLVAWIVYTKGGVSGESKGVVETGVPGGAVGMMVGAGVGVLVSLYEVMLRK